MVTGNGIARSKLHAEVADAYQDYSAIRSSDYIGGAGTGAAVAAILTVGVIGGYAVPLAAAVAGSVGSSDKRAPLQPRKIILDRTGKFAVLRKGMGEAIFGLQYVATLCQLDPSSLALMFCEQVDFCRLAKKHKKELDLCKAVADGMATLKVSFPLPLGTLAVYMVCERGLDNICKCEH